MTHMSLPFRFSSVLAVHGIEVTTDVLTGSILSQSQQHKREENKFSIETSSSHLLNSLVDVEPVGSGNKSDNSSSNAHIAVVLLNESDLTLDFGVWFC